MAAELVNSATSEKLREMDWMKNIEICELVARDHRQAKEVIKSIKKRLGIKNADVQLFAVMLLEMLMNNCGEHIHKQVIEIGLLPVLVKIVKKKTDFPVRERIFLLLDATQTALGGASGKFPQYYAAYYDLVSARVQFPQRSRVPQHPASAAPVNNLSNQESVITKNESATQQSTATMVSDSSIIEKAAGVLEVLREVLNALDPQHPEGASDEFTLDLVEQCSFQKQRVMHLVMTSRDEKVVSRAIELNEQLHKVLTKHDVLLSGDHEHVEEEDADCLLRRIRKGKACADGLSEASTGSFGSTHGEKLSRPPARPLCIEPMDSDGSPPTVAIPPPPSKHVERERYFKEKKVVEGSTLAGHMTGLSLHSRHGSSSCGGSTDFGERDNFG
uniref:TOM1-like protein 2 n=1 Tax=Anthurium amnicola TaxID=1678845 RepID=A0A1D1ZJY4_9ARAE